MLIDAVPSVAKQFLKVFLPSVLLLVTSVHGQESEVQQSVLTGLPGVSVVVEPLSEDLIGHGITTEGIDVDVRLRLKEAGVRVFDPEIDDIPAGNPTLYIQLTAILSPGVERCTYTIRLDVLQAARLERDPDFPSLQLPTWGVGGVSIQGRSWRQAIFDDVLAYTDTFVTAFQAANPSIAD